jgi:hypothetical protein
VSGPGVLALLNLGRRARSRGRIRAGARHDDWLGEGAERWQGQGLAEGLLLSLSPNS